MAQEAFCGLESDPIIERHSDRLSTPKMPFGGLDGRVTEQELDLFEVATALAAELGARAAEIMGAEALGADLFG